MVVIDHGGGLVTLYMHLSRFEDGQKVGTTVKQKDVIGYVGMTGLATGPHLHFGVRKGGRYVDPATVENARAPGVPKQHRAAFDRARKDLDERLLAEQSDSDPGR
jgi:murein DD-endopeptidase MepM/ murein hydrolase activator NlpD